MRDSARQVGVKLDPFSVHALDRWSRSVARGDAPGESSIAGKLLWIAHRILLLHINRAPAVFEVVDRLATHVLVLNSAKVDPHMREMMNEEWTGIKKLVTIDPLPVVSPGPGPVTLFRKWIAWRSKSENVEDQRFAIAAPAISDELRLWFPSVTDG